jgi:hypothetical protein
VFNPPLSDAVAVSPQLEMQTAVAVQKGKSMARQKAMRSKKPPLPRRMRQQLRTKGMVTTASIPRWGGAWGVGPQRIVPKIKWPDPPR